MAKKPVIDNRASESTELAKPTETALMAAPPSFLAPASAAARGLEAVERTDIIIPRLVLAQQMTPLVQDGKLNQGDIFLNISGERLVSDGEPLRFIPITMTKARLMFDPDITIDVIHCRSEDSIKANPGGVGKMQDGSPTSNCADCVNAMFDHGSKDSTPACTLFYNIAVILPDYDNMLCVWSLKGTGVKVAKRFLSMVSQSRRDMFSKVYELKSVPEQTDKFKYRNFEFVMIDWVRDESMYKFAEQMYGEFQNKSFKVSDLEHDKPVTPDAEPEFMGNTDVNPRMAAALGIDGKKGDVPF